MSEWGKLFISMLIAIIVWNAVCEAPVNSLLVKVFGPIPTESPGHPVPYDMRESYGWSQDLMSTQPEYRRRAVDWGYDPWEDRNVIAVLDTNKIVVDHPEEFGQMWLIVRVRTVYVTEADTVIVPSGTYVEYR